MLTSGPEIRGVITDYMKTLLSLFDVLRTSPARDVVRNNRAMVTGVIPLLRTEPFMEMMKSTHDFMTTKEAEQAVSNLVNGQEALIQVVGTDEFKAFSDKFSHFWDQAVKLLDKDTDFRSSSKTPVQHVEPVVVPTYSEPLAPLSFYTQLLDMIDGLAEVEALSVEDSRILRRLARRHDVEITTLYQSFLDRHSAEAKDSKSDERLVRDLQELAGDVLGPIKLSVSTPARSTARSQSRSGTGGSIS